MEEIIWSSRASKDAFDIYQYIALDSKLYADRWIDKIIDRISTLPIQPKSGRVVPEKNNPDIREIIEGNYRIMYKISKGNSINIYRIIHSARFFK